MVKCGTCMWFAPEGKAVGRCLVDPPVVQVVMPPPTAIGAQPRPAVQGLRPPTSAEDRCSRHLERLNHDARPGSVHHIDA